MSTLGHGFGLRTKHYPELLAAGAPAPCVEVVTENFLGRGGRPAAVLERVRQDSEVVLHGVSLSIGGIDPLDDAYLGALRELADRIDARVVSDHACFGGFGGHRGHDLWPLPFTEEAVSHVASRVRRVQDLLGRRIALENVSSYLSWSSSAMTEWAFLTEVAERADCHLLLDVNNVQVSAHNHGFDPVAYLEGLPRERIAQIHLAGHSERDGYLFDDHGSRVPDVVWALYERAVRMFGDVTSIVEWDENVPSLDRLREEAERARRVASEALRPAHAHLARVKVA
jgi:uncharacterized protein